MSANSYPYWFETDHTDTAEQASIKAAAVNGQSRDHSVGKFDAQLRRKLLHVRIVMQEFRLREPGHQPGEPRNLLVSGGLQPFH